MPVFDVHGKRKYLLCNPQFVKWSFQKFTSKLVAWNKEHTQSQGGLSLINPHKQTLPAQIMRVASYWDSRDRMVLIPWLLQEGPALLSSKSRSTFLLALSPLSACLNSSLTLPVLPWATLPYPSKFYLNANDQWASGSICHIKLIILLTALRTAKAKTSDVSMGRITTF